MTVYSTRILTSARQSIPALPVHVSSHHRHCVWADAKGYTRGFEESIGYKKGYAAGEKLAREQAANMNAANQK